MKHALGVPYDAVVLAGGAASRLGGVDKPGLLVGGRTLAARVAAAVASAERIVLVGPPRPDVPTAIVVREDPPGGGPVPALRAGLARVRGPWVAVLAGDLPFLTARHVEELRRRAHGGPGAILVDAEERPQWLTGVWRAADLSAALREYRGGSLRGLLEPLGPVRVRLPDEERPAWYDCDTRADVETASRMLSE